MVAECGFEYDYILESLKEKNRNHATATYYLLKNE